MTDTPKATPTILEAQMVNPMFSPEPDKSAAVFIQALRELEMNWLEQLPKDSQIVIYVVVPGHGAVELGYIGEQGYNGVFIQGHDADGETYVLIAHQATLQFFCKVRKVTPEQPRRPIGFGPHPPDLHQAQI